LPFLVVVLDLVLLGLLDFEGDLDGDLERDCDRVTGLLERDCDRVTGLLLRETDLERDLDGDGLLALLFLEVDFLAVVFLVVVFFAGDFEVDFLAVDFLVVVLAFFAGDLLREPEAALFLESFAGDLLRDALLPRAEVDLERERDGLGEVVFFFFDGLLDPLEVVFFGVLDLPRFFSVSLSYSFFNCFLSSGLSLYEPLI